MLLVQTGLEKRHRLNEIKINIEVYYDTDNYNRHSLDNVRSDTVEHKGVRHEIK